MKYSHFDRYLVLFNFYLDQSSSDRILLSLVCILFLLLCSHGNIFSDAHSDSRDDSLFWTCTGALCNNPGCSQLDTRISRQMTFSSKKNILLSHYLVLFYKTHNQNIFWSFSQPQNSSSVSPTMTDFPTLSYTSTSEIPTLSYTWSLKKVPLLGKASPYRPL